MDYAATPAPPRRIIRRSLPWLMAMGLFTGGGYGVFTYAVPKAADLTADRQASVGPAASGAVVPISTNDQVKRLFAPSSQNAAPAATATESETSVAAPRYADRYTPVGNAVSGESAAQPPQAGNPSETAAAPRSAAAVTLLRNPFTAPPAATQNAAAQIDSAPAPVATPTHEIDLARGQEPTTENPLRSGVAPGSAAAREAFSNEAPAVPPLSVTNVPTPGEGATPVSGDAGIQGPGVNPFARYSAGAAPVSATASASETPSAAAMFSSEPSGPVAQPTAAATEPTPTSTEPAPTDAPESPAAKSARFAPLSAKPLRPQQATSFATEVAQPEPTTPPTDAPAQLAPRNATPQYVATADVAAADTTPTPGIAAVEGGGRPGDRSLEGVQAPALTVQKLAPPEVQVGKKCTFAVKVQNTGRLTAHQVQIHDEVPLGAQLIGSAPKATVAGSQLIWDVGTLSAGEERIVEMELMPVTEGELGSVATVTFAAQASAKSRCTRPELALRLAAGPRVMIGQQHIVEIEITNPGSGDAAGVMLLENVPQGVKHEAGPSLEFEVGTLRAGETKRLDLVLTAAEAGRIHNVMTARADAGLEIQAACEFEVIAPKLAVSVEGPSRRYLERPATYTVNIENPGTAAAKEVQLITQLPKGLKFVSANNLGEYDAATHSVHWSLAELPANERGTVELTALPVEAGEHTLQVASRAEQGLEERAETRLVVEGLVALSFDIDAADGAIEVGGETAYDVTVRNLGSKPAANVQVQAVIPGGLRATGGEGATRHVVQGDRVMFAPIPQLPPKGEAKFTVKVQGLQSGDQRTRIMVMADEVQEPITKEESTRVYSDQ